MDHVDDFGELVRFERLKLGLRYGEVARRLLGHGATLKQISRLSQRLVEIERTGRRDKRLVARLVALLHLDPVSVSVLIDAEKHRELQRFREWMAEPVEPVLHIRAIPGVWIAKRLPGFSTDDALRTAADFARQKRVIVCLALDRSLAVWFDREGREYARVATTATDEPKVHTFVSGHPVLFEADK